MMKKTLRRMLLALLALSAVLSLAACGALDSFQDTTDDADTSATAMESGLTQEGQASPSPAWVTMTFTDADTRTGPLVVVNAEHPYVFPSEAPEDDPNLEVIYAAWSQHSPRIYQLSGLSKYMNVTALAAMDTMISDFHTATGKNNILISYSYRTAAEQANFSTPAGYSDHHTGYGVVLKYTNNNLNYDLLSENADPAYKWLYENCHKYGFVTRYPEEKADKTGVSDYLEYFRYVGEPHATYMTEKNLCLEEYVELLKGYTQDKPLSIKGADGVKYLVYYTAVSGSTEIKVPSNFEYTVSGNNEGGAIITVNLSKPV